MHRIPDIVFLLVVAGAAPAARGEDLRFAPQVAVPATFTFKPTVEVQGDRIQLGELADCVGVDLICEEAYGVDLGPAPAPGKLVVLTTQRLEELLSHEWDAAAIEVKAPMGVRVSAGFAEIDTDSVQAALQKVFDERFPENAAYKVEVTRVQLTGRHKLRPVPHAITFPAFEDLAKRNEDWLVKNLVGPHKIDVRYVPEGEADAFETYGASATFGLKKRLPVATRNMQRGDIIRDSDLTPELVDLGRGTAAYVSADKDAIGRRLRRTLAIGMPLQPGMLEVPIVVRNGQTVRLLLASGGLTVTSHVRVLASGSYGQAVDAVSLTTKKKMRVKVIDSTTVEYLQ